MNLAKTIADFDALSQNMTQACKSSPDALCVTLREVASQYAKPCSFKAGDLVTPRRVSDLMGAGEPHIVLEVIDRPEPDFTVSDPKDTASSTYGARRNMRVAWQSFASISAFWVESYQFESYALPTESIDPAA